MGATGVGPYNVNANPSNPYMKHLLYAALLLLTAGALAACSESEEESHELDNWEARNWTYFTDKYTEAATAIESGDSTWKIIRNWSLEEEAANDSDDYIVVEVLEAGTGSGCPMYTDSAYVHYSGRLIPTDSYPNGYNFDSSYDGDLNIETAMPQLFAVSALIDGFITALLNMHIGDYWRVYIPYNLGYGTVDASSIPAYSTLIFDIYLEAYYRVGVTVPIWKAKEWAFDDAE